MSGASNRQPTGAPHSDGAARGLLERIPLSVRMLVYGVAFLALILVLLPWCADRVGRFLLPARQVEIGAWRIAGWILLAGALAVYLRSSFLLSSRGRGAYVEFDPPTEFVASGPFRWCRNPIAGCVVLMLLAIALAFSSIGVAALFLLSLILAHLQVVLLEEPLLTKRFGEPYRAYLRTVPRWIPRPPRDGPQ